MHGIYRINDRGSRRRVALRYGWQPRDEGRSHGGGAVWLRGRLDNIIALITPEDGLAKHDCGGFSACACGVRQVFAGPVCDPGSPLGGLVRPPKLDDVRRCVRSFRDTDLIRTIPFIRLVGVVIVFAGNVAPS